MHSRPATSAPGFGIFNPYEELSDRSAPLTGEIHTHVNKGLTAPRPYQYGEDAGAIYAAARGERLDFVAMSVEVVEKNGGVEQFGDVRAENTHGVIGLPAREIQNNLYSSRPYFEEAGADFLHVLTLGDATNGISICAHPRFYEMAGGEKGSWGAMKSALLSPDEGGLLEKMDVRGIEIFNGHTLATLQDQGRRDLYKDYDETCWDDLLMAGMLCWGFAANDAFVTPGGYARFSPLGCVRVFGAERSAVLILDALKQGRFYSSTGVVVAPPQVQVSNDGRLRIIARAQENVDWAAIVCAPRGAGHSGLQTLRVASAPRAAFKIEPGWSYVRVQCTSTANPWRRAWLQPIVNGLVFGGPI
jgi:hypothetical protein